MLLMFMTVRWASEWLIDRQCVELDLLERRSSELLSIWVWVTYTAFSVRGHELH